MNEFEDHETAPPGSGTMNRLRWGLIAVLAVVAVLSLGGYVLSRRGGSAETASASQALYHCPMHPTYTSDKPGECPICGMDLELVSESGGSAAMDPGDVPGLTSVHVSPERLQLIGVRTAAAERQALASNLELVGFVAPDEARLSSVQLRTSGWIEKLYINRTGDVVTKGAPLLAIYSPQLYQSENEFLIELDARKAQNDDAALASARERLRLLGIPDDEIARLEKERTPQTHLTLRSPVAGTVLERNVVEGQRVSANTALFSIADLSRVWVLADLYEIDFTKVRVGDKAVFTADALPQTKIEGRVGFIYPTVSNETRTLKVRMVMDNKDGRLRPGMYGRVRVSARALPGLSVPLEAVVNTGEQHYVFVVRDAGVFEPRTVQVGLQDGNRIQIMHGLAEGDTVVASATFLIDSESRLKAAIEGMSSGMPEGHQHGGTP